VTAAGATAPSPHTGLPPGAARDGGAGPAEAPAPSWPGAGLDGDRAEASLVHLRGRLALVEAAVRTAVALRRQADPGADDPFRGLYLADEQVNRLLDAAPARPAAIPAAAVAAVEVAADRAERAGAELRLRRLARGFGLDPLDLDLLLVALAPDLDPRFERLYAYLNDDVTRRRAQIGLALELCGATPTDAAARRRLGRGGALVAGGLVEVEEPERPFLTRPLRVPDRVASHLLGDDTLDPDLAGIADTGPTDWAGGPLPSGRAEAGDPVLPGSAAGPGSPDGPEEVEHRSATAASEPPRAVERVTAPEAGTSDDPAAGLARALAAGARLAYVRERPGGGGTAVGAAGLRAAGLPALVLDLGRLDAGAALAAAARAAAREARLRGAGLVAGPVEALAGRGAAAVRAFAELPATVVLTGRVTWDPAWARDVPAVVEAPGATPAERAACWRGQLAGGPVRWPAGLARCSEPAPSQLRASPAGGDPGLPTAHFLLSAEQVARAARAAQLQAAVAGTEVTPWHLRAGARAQNAAGLERLARRIEPAVSWDDLVLPAATAGQLHELAARARHRDRVLAEWGLRPGGGRGRGVTALFAGDSGTGKTMSAEVIAGALGLDLYAVNLATVVDKYVGETEKNLERVFAEAEGVNGVLLFDEADAIFGKRSEVRDAHDRYANLEIAYLLQRMESFDGLAVLATNLRANLDEAFTRRLDAIVDFPLPDEAARRRLWERCLGGALPRGRDLDLDFCAGAFELSGGSIASIALAAAYLAAEADRPLAMADLVHAVHREYRKLGRLARETEFGPYHGLVAT